VSDSAAESEARLNAALECYPQLGSPRVNRIQRGLIHDTWRVDDEDDGQSYVLQQLNPIFALGVHENIEAVTARLAERGVETPRLCRTREGALYADLQEEGGRYRLMTFVEGAVEDVCPSPEHAADAAGLVARFHSALDDLPHDFAPLGFAFHDTDRYFAALDRAVDTRNDHPMHAEAVALARRLHEIRADWEPLGDVPDRVVHLDLKFNNILFRDGRACCLIDLDTLSRAPMWVELGDAWRSWCNRRREHEAGAELDTEIFEASAAAWLGAVELDLGAAEVDSLAHAIERISAELAVRFVTDILEESYFAWNADLFGSAAEHNLGRARGQLSLHDQARETRADRLKFLRDHAP
jgi:Ser/Thr protein kinase RdoA (MazF antagonist)